MARSMRARKERRHATTAVVAAATQSSMPVFNLHEVNYSDPGELSITQIRRGVAKPADVRPSKPSKTNGVKPKTAGTAAGKSGEAQVQMQAKPQARKQAAKLAKQQPPKLAKQQPPKLAKQQARKQVSPTKKSTRRATRAVTISKAAAAADVAAPTTAKGKRKSSDVSGKPKPKGGGGSGGGTASIATVGSAGDAGAAPAAKRRQVARRARGNEGGDMERGTSATSTDKENASEKGGGSLNTRVGSGDQEEVRTAEGEDARTATRYVSTLEAPCPMNRRRPAPPATRRRCGRDAERAPTMRSDDEDAPTPPQYALMRKTCTGAGSESLSKKGASSSALPTAGALAAPMATVAPEAAAAPPSSSMARATASSLSSLSLTSSPSANMSRSSKRRGVGAAGASLKTGGSSSWTATPEGTPTRQRRSTAAHPFTPGSVTRDAAGFPLALHSLQSTMAQQTFLSELGDILTAIETKAKGARGQRRSSSKIGAAASSREGGSGADEAAYWKARFDELFALKVTEPEKQLALIQEHAAEKERKAEQYIAHLRKNVHKVPEPVKGTPATPGASSATSTAPTAAASAATAAAATTATTGTQTEAATATAAATTATTTTQTEAATSTAAATTATTATQTETATSTAAATTATQTETATATAAEEPESDADRLAAPSAYVRSLEEKIEHHRRVIRLYQTLSSLAIHPKEGQEGGVEGDVMTCTAVNHVHRRAVRFDLKIPEDEESEDFAYHATGNIHLLPEYMREDLLFTNKQCPLFLAKLLQNLFRT